MTKENADVQASQELSVTALTLSGLRLPNRPGYGTEGKKIVLKTNSFRMSIDPSRKIYRYDVEVSSDKARRKDQDPNAEPTLGRRVRQNAFEILLETSEFQSVREGIATDFAKTIITSKRLNLGTSGRRIFQIVYHEKEETVPHVRPITYKFIVSSEIILPISKFLSYLSTRTADHGDFDGQDIVQAFNIIMARTPNRNPDVFQAGGNKFFRYPSASSQYVDLGEGLIAVRGYYSSVRTSTMRTLLNVNAQCSPFYPAINMVSLMERHSRWNPQSWETLEAFVEKLRVKTEYMRDKNGKPDIRVKTVIGLSHKFEEKINPKTGKLQKYGNADGDHGNPRQLVFDCDEFPDGRRITVEKYFLRSMCHNST